MRDKKVFILYLEHFDTFRNIQSFIFKTQHIGIIDFEFSIYLIETGKKKLVNLFFNIKEKSFFKACVMVFFIIILSQEVSYQETRTTRLFSCYVSSSSSFTIFLMQSGFGLLSPRQIFILVYV